MRNIWAILALLNLICLLALGGMFLKGRSCMVQREDSVMEYREVTNRKIVELEKQVEALREMSIGRQAAEKVKSAQAVAQEAYKTLESEALETAGELKVKAGQTAGQLHEDTDKMMKELSLVAEGFLKSLAAEVEKFNQKMNEKEQATA